MPAHLSEAEVRVARVTQTRTTDALCDAVQQRPGEDVDLKAFRRAALDLGSFGLDPLRAALERL